MTIEPIFLSVIKPVRKNELKLIAILGDKATSPISKWQPFNCTDLYKQMLQVE